MIDPSQAGKADNQSLNLLSERERNGDMEKAYENRENRRRGDGDRPDCYCVLL
jgi:hypothetical protein